MAGDLFDFERVRAADVSRYYGRRRALAHVTLDFEAGQITGLFGPNGSGKSTLLGILSTLLAAATGEVRYGDRRARESGRSLRRRIGYVAHDLHLYPDLSARANLGFFAAMYGVPQPAAAIADALNRAGLSERADDPVNQFSRGMRQRLSVERALLHAPRLVLMDEPFTGLDTHSVNRLLERLGELRGAGAIVVLATHDRAVATGIVDRAVTLDEGRLCS